ncbi:MAG: ThiF family adenylyltransferase [Eubacterium sp.]|nr:ThiF family adenylyltransferase [Eubacterium sp.]
MKKNGNSDSKWIITAQVYEEIRQTIGCRKPEQGGILGSSDGVHIDYYYFDKTADRSSASYTMDHKTLNKVIHKWNDNGIQLVGIIHSHPYGFNSPSIGDRETASHIIKSLDVKGRFFTPIVQVSPKLNGDITIYPYSFEETIEMKKQPMIVEQADVSELKRKKQLELDRLAPNRFKRIESVFPDNLMSKKTVICIGCGGSRTFLETLARCGVGNFVLFDADVIEDTNIATQGAYISEIGKLKTEVIKERILDINPLAEVKCINRFLDNEITDDEFDFITNLNALRKGDVLLCGCTDDFYAQDRCAQLSVKFSIPYLAAQIFKEGKGHEVIFYYPGVTASCPRCMLASRYKKMFETNEKAVGSSAGAAVCVTDYLNAIKSYTALYILCYREPQTPLYHLLDRMADRNYLMTKCSFDFTAPAFVPLEELAEKESDLSFPFVTIAIGQTPEADCPLCKGYGIITKDKVNIADTRNIPDNQGKKQ